MNQVTSSDDSICEAKCSESCNNIHHNPPIKNLLHDYFVENRIELDCPRCVPSFLLAFCTILSSFCIINRHELTTPDFITASLSLYNVLHEDFRLCKTVHTKTPPVFECQLCNNKYFTNIFDMCERWFMGGDFIAINIFRFIEVIVNNWTTCPNNCNVNLNLD